MTGTACLSTVVALEAFGRIVLQLVPVPRDATLDLLCFTFQQIFQVLLVGLFDSHLGGESQQRTDVQDGPGGKAAWTEQTVRIATTLGSDCPSNGTDH